MSKIAARLVSLAIFTLVARTQTTEPYYIVFLRPATDRKPLSQSWRHPYQGQFYSLSFLGEARGFALAGDTANARKAFQDFFELWKDPDPDIPIPQQAKAEFAKLH